MSPRHLPAALAAVALLTLAGSAAHAERPDTPGTSDLFAYDDGDVVEFIDTARFRIHFTRAGNHAVPLADDDLDGTPDHVQAIGALYEDVLTFYTVALGYRTPLADDDARFDVYLLDFAFSADGAFRAETCAGGTCAGFLIQENDFAGYGYPSVDYANTLLASHELFHAVQAAYDDGQGAVLGEGTAVWASEQFDPSLDDLEGFGAAYLDDTSRPLDSAAGGPVDPFTYGTAVFWEHLAVTFGDDVIRALWEACVGGADWLDVIDDVIVAHGGEGFAATFAELAATSIGAVSVESATLPVQERTYLVFTSSFRTLAVNPGDRTQLRIALAGEGVDVDGVRLVVAPDGAAGEVAASLDVTRDAVDALFRVAVVNTRREGNGARPRLCIGTSAEVDACLAATDVPAEEPPLVDDPPSSCATAPIGPTSAVALAVLWLGARVRRRR